MSFLHYHIKAVKGFDNIINYLTPSAKKRGLVHTDGVKKLISYEHAKTSMFEFSNFYLAFTEQAYLANDEKCF